MKKKLLATASTLAILSIGIPEINAAVKTNAVNSNAVLVNGGGSISVINAVTGLPDNFANGDSFYFSSANSLSTGGVVIIAAIGVEGFAVGPFTINHDTTLGSVSSTNANKLAINITNGNILTLNGTAGISKNAVLIPPNFYGGLGDITLNGNSGLNITAPVTLSSNIIVNGVNGETATFTGFVKAASLSIPNGALAEFSDNTSFDLITLGHNNSQVKFTSARGQQVTVTINNHLDTSINNKGVIELHSDNADSILEVRGGALGNANNLQEIKVTGTEGVRLKSAIRTDLLAIEDGAFLEATDASITSPQNITIGADSFFKLSPNINININPVSPTQIIFADNTSSVVLRAEDGNQITFTLQNDLDPGNVDSGILILESRGDDGAFIPTKSQIILTGNGGRVQTLGTGVNKIFQLIIDTEKTSVITPLVSLSNINELLIDQNATTTIQTKSFVDIPVINIEDGGTIIFDTTEADTDLLDGGQQINFNHTDSTLVLMNSSAVNDRVITLKADLAPGGHIDKQGNLEIKANGQKTLTIDSNGGNIGTNGNEKLDVVTISGDKLATINPKIFAQNVVIKNTQEVIFDGEIETPNEANLGLMEIEEAPLNGIKFNQNEKIGIINTNDKAARIILADGKSLKVDSIVREAGRGARLILGHNSSIEGYNNVKVDIITLDTIETIPAIGNSANLAGGGYVVGEIKAANAGTLNFADGFNLTGTINSSAGGAADLNFAGNGFVSGTIGRVGNSVGMIRVGANSILKLGGSVWSAGIQGNVANNETLRFILGEVIVNAPVGDVTKFKNIQFNGGNVQFNTNQLNTDKVQFISAGTVKVVTAGINMGGIEIENTSNLTNHQLIVSGIDQNFIKAVGGDTFGANKFFGTVIMASDNKITVGAADFYANLATQNDGQASVLIVGEGVKGDIGSYDFTGVTVPERFKEVRFVQDGKVNNIYSNNVIIEDNKIAVFGGDNTVFKTMTMGANSVANFQKDFPFTNITEQSLALVKRAEFFNIKTAPSSGAKINFYSNATINELRNFEEINFHRDAILLQDIEAKKINFNGKVFIAENLSLSGGTKFNDSEIVLGTEGDKDLKFKEGTTTMAGEVVVRTKVQNSEGMVGNLVVDRGSTLSVSGTLTFIVDNTLGTFEGEKITLIRGHGGQTLINLDNITVESDRFSSWVKAREDKTGNIIFTSYSKVKESLTQSRDKAGISESVISNETIEVLNQALPGTQAYNFLKQIVQMTPNAANEAVARTTTSINAQSAQISTDIANSIEQVINARIGNNFSSLVPTAFASGAPVINDAPGASEIANNNPVGLPNTSVKHTEEMPQSKTFAGIAAGDDPALYGLWASPIYVNAQQKTNNGAAGYRAVTSGITFGFDTKVNEDTVVGASLSFLSTSAKFKGYKSGDKAKMDSLLWSIYGLRELTNNFFVQSIFTFGSTRIRNTESRRTSNTETQIAVGKYSSMLFSAEILGGYNKVISNKFVVTPIVGVNYQRVNDASYNETGAAINQNRKVMKKANDKIECVAGLRVSNLPIIVNEIEISSEIHGFIRHDLVSRKIQIDLDIDSGTDKLYAKDSPKPARTRGNIGVGINAKYSMMDYGASYDLNLSKKFIGHQGSLKIRVNF